MSEPFSSSVLEPLARRLGELITGTEMTRLLAESGLRDPEGSGVTKWRRLLAAFTTYQSEHRVSNGIVRFTVLVLAPVRYAGHASEYDQDRHAVNEVLAFEGVSISDSGIPVKISPSNRVSEASDRARRLRNVLEKRNLHHDVIKSCRAELVEDNYFHAVLEAVKGLAMKVREKSGLNLDGKALISAAFVPSTKGALPVLAFNKLETESERNEHAGLVDLMTGIIGAFRNPLAHELRIRWAIDVQDAIDVLTLVSLLHRKVDAAVPTQWNALDI